MRQLMQMSIIACFCLSAVIPVFAKSSVVIDSLAGNAQIQRAGKGKWLTAKKGMTLHNNDIIRVAEKSGARLKWTKEDFIYLKENSQILINLHESKHPSLISQHFTVFYGAAFFIIETLLPSIDGKRFDTKVYSPTSVVAIRGTSFCVEANKENGKTNLIVINGIVLTRNILRNVSIFVSAGHKTEIAINTDPIQPSPVVQTDIASLKKWVPLDILNKEMKKQHEKSKRDRTIISGELEEKVVIVPFVNTSSYQGKWALNKQFANLLSHKINKETAGMKAMVTGKSGADPIETGIKAKAQYVITGEIIDFDIAQHAKVTTKADSYSEFSNAKVSIRLNLIDVSENKMKYDNTFTGENIDKNIPKNSWKEVNKLKFDMNEKNFSSSIIGIAIKRALDQGSNEIARYLRN